MTHENILHTNHTQEKFESPCIVESAEIQPVSEVAINKGVIVIGEKEYDRFGWVSYLQQQQNGMYGFSSVDEKDLMHKKFIDPSLPDKDFPSIDVDKNNLISVGGFPWVTLNGKDIFSGGYLGTIDPITEDIVFRTIGDHQKQNSEVIVNNIAWHNKFGSIHSAESYNGKVLVVGSKGAEDALYINDKEWVWPAHANPEIKKQERFWEAVTNGDGVVAALVSSRRSKTGAYSEHVFVGDDVGSEKEWTTIFDANKESCQIAVDKHSDTVAVIGIIDSVPSLVINDIVCKLSRIPFKIEKMSIENGVVFVQYVNAVGKQFAEKVSLNENAREVQEQNGEKRAVEEAMYIIRRLLHEQGSNPHELVGMTLKHADLKNENKKLEIEANKVHELQNKINVLTRENTIVNDAKVRVEGENVDLKLEIQETQNALLEVEKLLEEYAPGKKKGMISKNTGMPEEMHKKFTKAVKKKNGKETLVEVEEKVAAVVEKEAENTGSGGGGNNKAQKDWFS